MLFLFFAGNLEYRGEFAAFDTRENFNDLQRPTKYLIVAVCI
jgi:hypothetical protein